MPYNLFDPHGQSLYVSGSYPNFKTVIMTGIDNGNRASRPRESVRYRDRYSTCHERSRAPDNIARAQSVTLSEMILVAATYLQGTTAASGPAVLERVY